MSRLRYILPLSLLLVTANCALRKNNGAGYGGGDPAYAVLQESQTRIGESAKLILSGVDIDALCSARQCQFPNEGSQCSLLDSLSNEQRTFCASVLQSHSAHLQNFSRRSLGEAFYLTNETITVGDSQGAQIPVVAKTILGQNSPIVVNRQRLQTLSGNEIVALLAHEVGHQHPYSGGLITDNGPVGPFESGRALLDAVGAALAIYQNDHYSRAGSLDYSFFNGRLSIPFGGISISSGVFGSDSKLHLISSRVGSVDSGILDLSQTVGVFHFGASGPSYAAVPDALGMDEFNALIVPVTNGDTVYLFSKYAESGSLLGASRFKASGSLDISFGDLSLPGRVTLSELDPGSVEHKFVIEAQVDDLNRLHFGDCVSDGATHSCDLVRLMPDGARDEVYNARIKSALAQFNAGSSLKLLRLNPDRSAVALIRKSDDTHAMVHILEDGSIDTSFGENGISAVRSSNTGMEDVAESLEFVAINRSVGKILVIEQSSTNHRVVITRYSSQGILDTDFATGGIFRITPSGSDLFTVRKVVCQENGRILLVGSSNDVYLKTMRLTQAGAVDQSYGDRGVSLIPLGDYFRNVLDATIDSGGKLLVGLGGVSAENGFGNGVSILRITL